MKDLYHGSETQGIRVLIPKKRFTPAGEINYSAIYATPSPAFAICHSFPWSSDEGIDSIITDTEKKLIIPSIHKERLEKPVSLYRISSDGFQHTAEDTTEHTWHATKEAPIIEEMRYDTVKNALKEHGVIIEYTG